MVKLKTRYIMAELVSESNRQFPTNVIYKAILTAIGDMHGDWGYSACESTQVRVCDGGTVVLRVTAEHVNIVASVLPFIKVMEGEPLVIRTIFHGASIRSCEKRLIKLRRDELTALYPQCKSLYEKKKLLRAIRSVTGKVHVGKEPRESKDVKA